MNDRNCDVCGALYADAKPVPLANFGVCRACIAASVPADDEGDDGGANP